MAKQTSTPEVVDTNNTGGTVHFVSVITGRKGTMSEADYEARKKQGTTGNMVDVVVKPAPNDAQPTPPPAE